jgi:periplasmic divalent cation tolerance protein
MELFMVYVTCEDEEEAMTISKSLLDKRLVACANIFPIRSLYWWEGEMVDDSEVAIIMKTQKRHMERVISEVKSLHSYEVPCIEFLPIPDGNPDYLKWISDETEDG